MSFDVGMFKRKAPDQIRFRPIALAGLVDEEYCTPFSFLFNPTDTGWHGQDAAFAYFIARPRTVFTKGKLPLD